MKKTALLAGALATSVVACGSDFNKPARLETPRILAIKAEPPQPSVGVSTTLSTLLYQPPLDRVADKCQSPGPTTSKWSWCPIGMVADSATNTFKCPFPEESFRQLYASLGLGEAPPFELGYGDTMTFTNPFPSELLYALCRGDIGSVLGGNGSTAAGKSVFSCDLPASDIAANVDISKPMNTHPIGFTIAIKVEVTPACPELLPAGFSPLIGLYSLHLPTREDVPLNQNPVIGGIFATENVVLDAGAPSSPLDSGVMDAGAETVDGGQPVPDGAVPLEEQPLVTVKRDKHVGLALKVDISTAEHLTVPGRIDYLPVTQTQEVALTRHFEHLSFGWYGEAGDFTGRGKGRTTGYLPEALPDSQPDLGVPSDADQETFKFNTTNTWDLPRTEDYPHRTARIIVVIRDGRGGVDWTSKQVTLEDWP